MHIGLLKWNTGTRAFSIWIEAERHWQSDRDSRLQLKLKTKQDIIVIMYLYLKVDKTQPCTHTRRRENKKETNTSYMSLNNCQIVKLWCSASGISDLIQVQRLSRRSNRLAYSSSHRTSHKRFDSVFVSWGCKTPLVECERVNGLSTDNCRGLAILNVCILILIMPTTEVTIVLV